MGLAVQTLGRVPPVELLVARIIAGREPSSCVDSDRVSGQLVSGLACGLADFKRVG